jgi:hypothetical protein
LGKILVFVELPLVYQPIFNQNPVFSALQTILEDKNF